MHRLYTIGFAGKNAATFFSLLKNTAATHLIDIRLNNVSQLAAFTKKNDLKFFLREILGWDYYHRPELAPTKDILDEYKKSNNWATYEKKFLNLMEQRAVENTFTIDEIKNSVLLCSEKEPDYCHRRLVAEYLNSKWGGVFVVTHL